VNVAPAMCANNSAWRRRSPLQEKTRANAPDIRLPNTAHSSADAASGQSHNGRSTSPAICAASNPTVRPAMARTAHGAQARLVNHGPASAHSHSSPSA
jgi:hypothetical protein